MEKNKRRSIIIPNKIFNKLWKGAEKEDERQEFIRKYSSIMSKDYIDYKKLGLQYDEYTMLLKEIYVKQKMSFREILEAANVKKSEISSNFCIPIRTVEDWYSGRNKCASYIRLMILRYYYLINPGKYIYIEYEKTYMKNKPSVYKKS